MDLLKIFKKYKLVILAGIFIYFLRWNRENLTTTEPNSTYNNIIKMLCHSVSNKDSCVDSYKESCEENECNGKNGETLTICKNSCNSISL
tara:strand:+ start:58 stop:327 length:270 start_codon:yes stop_codon:yes gene_type:complete